MSTTTATASTAALQPKKGCLTSLGNGLSAVCQAAEQAAGLVQDNLVVLRRRQPELLNNYLIECQIESRISLSAACSRAEQAGIDISDLF